MAVAVAVTGIGWLSHWQERGGQWPGEQGGGLASWHELGVGMRLDEGAQVQPLRSGRAMLLGLRILRRLALRRLARHLLARRHPHRDGTSLFRPLRLLRLRGHFRWGEPATSCPLTRRAAYRPEDATDAERLDRCWRRAPLHLQHANLTEDLDLWRRRAPLHLQQANLAEDLYRRGRCGLLARFAQLGGLVAFHFH